MPPRSSRLWIAFGSAISGAATYALLVVVARALSPAHYGEFSFFWAVIVVASIGLYLPMEQLVVRRLARVDPRGPARKLTFDAGIRSSATVGIVSAIVLGVLWTFLRGAAPGESLYVLMLLAGLAGCVIQFPSRGALAASGDFRGYGLVVCIDAVARLVVAVGLWATGVDSPHAFAAAVAGSAILSGVAGRVLAGIRLSEVPLLAAPPSPSAVPARFLGREAARLVSAATCMQLLLNSGILIASVVHGPQASFAGHLVAVLTLARLPIFVAQSLQATYVSKLATHAHLGELVELRRLLKGLALAVAVVDAATLSVAVMIGPELITFIYGEQYVVGRDATVLVALGVVLYLAAAVTNDVAVAIGAFRRVQVAWVAGAIVACGIAVGVDDILLRSTLPLIFGSTVAASVLCGAVVRSAKTSRRAVV